MQTKAMLALVGAAMIAWASFVVFVGMMPRNEGSTLAPPIAETTTLEPLNWEAERPHSDYWYDYDETINRYYTDVGSINETVDWLEYHDLSFWLRINVAVALTTGYVHNISMTASQMIGVIENSIAVENLRVLPSNSSSYASFSGLNLPSRVTFKIALRWGITSPDNQTEQASVTVDIVYFNGTAYKKTTCPLYLKATGCINTNIENAEEIEIGQIVTKRWLERDRAHEFYKIHLEEGKRINVTVIPQEAMHNYLHVDLYVYNSSDLINPNYSSANPFIATENVTFVASATSWYFIEVTPESVGYGVYALRVSGLP